MRVLHSSMGKTDPRRARPFHRLDPVWGAGEDRSKTAHRPHHAPPSGVSACCKEARMPVFPSVEWFQALADIVNKDENYRKQGNCDATVGIKVGDRMFEIDFEAFEVTSVKELEA